MDIFAFLTEYKAVLSGMVIGFATITGASLNILYNRLIEGRLKRDRNASTASALAAELLYNSYHLRDVYLEIYKNHGKKYKSTEYKHIDVQVYHEILPQVGELGSAITFMVVDTYGNIKKMKGHMESLTDGQHTAKDIEAVLVDIQKALVKTLSCSITLYLYADYMTGKKWLKNISESRTVRIERTLDGFCKFIEEIDNNLDFIGIEERGDLEFRKRFKSKDDRDNVKQLFVAVRVLFKTLPKQPDWRAQLTLRSFSYITQNTLTRFLDIDLDEYDLISEHEYSRFLHRK